MSLGRETFYPRVPVADYLPVFIDMDFVLQDCHAVAISSSGKLPIASNCIVSIKVIYDLAQTSMALPASHAAVSASRGLMLSCCRLQSIL